MAKAISVKEKAESPIRHNGLNQERTVKGLCFCTFMPVSVQKIVPLHAEIINLLSRCLKTQAQLIITRKKIYVF